MTAPSPAPTADGSRELLARRPYCLFLAARFLGTLATGSQAVVLAWQVWGRVSAVSTLFIGASNELRVRERRGGPPARAGRGRPLLRAGWGRCW